MARKYKDTQSHGRYSIEAIRKGLKVVHIGDNVWKIGKISTVDSKRHQVIYGPGDKEYHLWDNEIKLVEGTRIDEYGDVYCDRNGNTSDQAKVKIYILTSILDKRENWCFDLTKIPKVGKLKVIYSSGQVKNIEFDGEFKKSEVTSKTHHPYDIYLGQESKNCIGNKWKKKWNRLKPGNVFLREDLPMVKTYINPIAYRTC